MGERLAKSRRHNRRVAAKAAMFARFAKLGREDKPARSVREKRSALIREALEERGDSR